MNWKLLLLSCALICAVSQAPAFAAALSPSHDKAAQVNGAVITSADFHDELRRVERLRGANNNSADPAESARNGKQALENLIVRELLYQEAGKRGTKVQAKVVDEELGKLKKQFSNEAEFKT